MILIIGGTGRLGSEAVRLLSTSGLHKIRVMSRDPVKAAFLARPGVEIISGGITDPKLLDQAMRSVERVLVIPPNLRNQAEVERSIYKSARHAGVSQIVKVSTVKANSNSTCHFFREHANAEKYLETSGVRATILRTNSFMQNLIWFAGEMRSKSTLSLPMGDAKTAPVDIRDVGAVAAAILSGQIHDGITYHVTGPEMHSFSDIVKELSKAIGKEVEYRDVAPAEFLETLIMSGVPNWYARAVAAAWAIAREGKPKITNVVLEIAKKNPITLEQFARDYAGAFLCQKGEAHQPSAKVMEC